MEIAVATVILIGVSAVLLSMYKSGKFFTSAILSALGGIASMLSVNALGLLTGFKIAVNAYTLVICALFGIPGTITLTLLNTVLLRQ